MRADPKVPAPGIRRLVAVLVLCLSGGVRSQPAGEKAIRAAYERASVAIRLLYLDGFLSQRADDFTLLTAGGARADARAERDRLAGLLDQATRAQMQTVILSFRPAGGKMLCSVEQLLTLETFNERSRRLQTSAYKTRCDDLWAEGPGGWKIQSSRVWGRETAPATPFPSNYMRNPKGL